MNPCPSCGSRKHIWDDNLHWGCSKCGWCSLSGISNSKPSNKSDESITDYQRLAENRRYKTKFDDDGEYVQWEDYPW